MGRTYQIDNTGWMKLIFRTLGEKEQTLSRLCGMGSIGMCQVGLLVRHVSEKMLMLYRLIAEPKKLLREDKAPD